MIRVPVNALDLAATAVGLAMDACAVSILTSIRVHTVTAWQAGQMAFTFGLFQAAMPCLGYLLGMSANRYLDRFDHWIAFAILVGIGLKMLYEARFIRRSADEATRFPQSTTLLALGLATSIDALAAGLTLGLIGTHILVAAAVIGVVTAILSLIGLGVGRRIGAWAGVWAEVLGGLVLIALGTRILISHLLR